MVSSASPPTRQCKRLTTARYALYASDTRCTRHHEAEWRSLYTARRDCGFHRAVGHPTALRPSAYGELATSIPSACTECSCDERLLHSLHRLYARNRSTPEHAVLSSDPTPDIPARQRSQQHGCVAASCSSSPHAATFLRVFGYAQPTRSSTLRWRWLHRWHRAQLHTRHGCSKSAVRRLESSSSTCLIFRQYTTRSQRFQLRSVQTLSSYYWT